MESMYYIGLDVHKKTMSYCVRGWERAGPAGRQDRSHARRPGQLDEDFFLSPGA